MRIGRGELPGLLRTLVGKTVVCIVTHHHYYKVGDRHVVNQRKGYVALGNTFSNGLDAQWEVEGFEALDLNNYL